MLEESPLPAAGEPHPDRVSPGSRDFPQGVHYRLIITYWFM